MAERIRAGLLMYYLPWGLTWLIGFGTFVLRDGIGNSGPYVSMPYDLPLIVLFALMSVAIIVSIAAGARDTRRLGGESTRQGIMYGWSWFLAFGTMMPITAQYAEHLSQDQRGMLFASVATGLTGTLYVAGGALWRSWGMFVLGGWLLVVNMAGVLAGPNWHSFLMAVAGGGGLICAGLAARLNWGRRLW